MNIALLAHEKKEGADGAVLYSICRCAVKA